MANKQGYTFIEIWKGDASNEELAYACIDRGEGKSFVVAHWVDVSDPDNITWDAGHYFENKKDALIYFKKQVIRDTNYWIEELKGYIAVQKREIKELQEET